MTTANRVVGMIVLLAIQATNVWPAEQPEVNQTHPITLVNGFGEHRAGSLLPAVGPTPEYHFVREATPGGPWAVTAFSSKVASQVGWRVVRRDGTSVLSQRFENREKHWHPLVVTGDRTWRDYRVIVSVTPQTAERRCGITVRTRNDRRYLFIGWDGDDVVIIRVRHEVGFRQPGETVLARAASQRPVGRQSVIDVTLDGDRLSAVVGGVNLSASAEDDVDGGVGLLSDSPAIFVTARVQCSMEAKDRSDQQHAATRAEIDQAARGLPAPKLWRTIATEDFGADRNLRFGDLTGDGRTEIVIGQIEHHGPRDSNSELSCLTAIDLEGNVLWQIGAPDRYRYHLTNDVGFQVHDLDGDGRCEVIYCKDMTIHVADGMSGKTLRSQPTPKNPNREAPANRFPRVLGDSIAVADLSGKGRATDILIKDRYRSFWVLNDKLQPLWSIECNTGHFPFPIDLDGDGRDEVAVGYSMIDSDGSVLWSRDEQFKDHADSIAVADLRGDGGLDVLWAGSDEGFIMLNDQGVPRSHLRVGHAQNLTIAELRPDLPGLEIAVMNFWRNQGILHILDSSGQVVGDYEPRCEHGSAIPPVNWSGGPAELLFVNPDPDYGGLYDGHGRCLVRLPADGHPTRAYDAIDLTGDARDELVVWDVRELWIYTQDQMVADASSAAPRKVVQRRRNGRENESNYRSRISLPK